MKKILAFVALGLLVQGCAVLHHVQIGEIDNRKGLKHKPIDLKVSETGVNLNDVKTISRVAVGDQGSKEIREVMDIVSMFQMGPRTGNGVYSIEYIKNIGGLLRSQCPNGNISGLLMVRETMKYPVISGEIVKVKGDCIMAAKD